MEIANKVAKDNSDVGRAPVPIQVRRSSLPDAESTRTPVKDPKDMRKVIERTTSKVDEVAKEEVKEVFSRSDEPEIRGSIVITLYKNHPYDVDFSGSITGSERDLAIKFLYKEYMVWKHKQARANELAIKNKEKEDARN